MKSQCHSILYLLSAWPKVKINEKKLFIKLIYILIPYIFLMAANYLCQLCRDTWKKENLSLLFSCWLDCRKHFVYICPEIKPLLGYQHDVLYFCGLIGFFLFSHRLFISAISDIASIAATNPQHPTSLDTALFAILAVLLQLLILQVFFLSFALSIASSSQHY